MARYRSWPAVSQICALIVLASTWIDRVANSTPMVDLESRLNSLRVNRESRLDFPTPESPISTTATDVSLLFGWGMRALLGRYRHTLEQELREKRRSVCRSPGTRHFSVHRIRRLPYWQDMLLSDSDSKESRE